MTQEQIRNREMTLHQAMINVASKIPVVDPAVRVRLDRGYNIVRSQGYTLSQHENSWLVYKESTSLLEDSSARYAVSESEGCTCPDAQTARGGLCKHRLAVMIKEEMMI